MARNFNGTTQYGTVTSNCNIASYPATLACWIKTTSTSATYRDPLGQGNTADTSQWVLLQLNDVHAALLGFNNGTSSGAAVGTKALNDGVWHHLCGVASGPATRIIYVDGVSDGTSRADVAFPSCDITTVGVFNQGGSLIQYFPGDVAECALWSAALDTLEIAILYRGFAPLFVRPQSLRAYWPILGPSEQILPGTFDIENDRVGHNNFTLANIPTTSNHPRVLYPSPLITSELTISTKNPVRRCRMFLAELTSEYTW